MFNFGYVTTRGSTSKSPRTLPLELQVVLFLRKGKKNHFSVYLRKKKKYPHDGEDLKALFTGSLVVISFAILMKLRPTLPQGFFLGEKKNDFFHIFKFYFLLSRNY